jgi:hypothetical protein
MRGFFVLLVIANLLFFAWQLKTGSQSDEVLPHEDTPLYREGLTLLSELEEGKMPPARKFIPLAKKSTRISPPAVASVAEDNKMEEAVGETSNPATVLHCYQSSLLETLDDAKALQQLLTTKGIRTSERREVQEQRINYWVMLPANKDLAKINSVVDVLRQKRVKDFFVVRGGRYENAISLGVYSTRERAEQRYKEISALKLHQSKPVIEVIELPAKRLVVTFQLVENALADGLQPLLDRDRQPYLQKIPCN